MDKFDKEILSILAQDGRRSVSDIARAVNLSRSAITSRIKKLEDDGVILGYQVKIAPPDASLSAYIALYFDTSRAEYSCDTYGAKLADIPEIKWVHTISGETDMMVFIEAPTMKRLNEIRDELQAMPHLKHLITHTVLAEFFNRRF
ncbi:Lrp/AsnC family transcriptional regulator [Vibrio sp. S9_S30]|uniref:Lrp/AsnC family transcriptional regulator n=1 Tax=Vibrio sp. S9_S30 TaxID=2720226 RepID=UPI00167FF20F|nr:Lrp/AsnC family transcriptional regulator [Vibrio sp. S9_S30]MBD1557115.1 Lrp/AsnC family transcriptional regulator [Vibrio sp. S9_S30]